VPAIARREQTVAARIRDPVCDEGGRILLSVAGGVNASIPIGLKTRRELDRTVIATEFRTVDERAALCIAHE
jgi:hypothetical protein